MLLKFFWKVMSWILLFHLLILENYIQRNKLYHGIWNFSTVLGTKSNNFCWRAAWKNCTRASGTPY